MSTQRTLVALILPGFALGALLAIGWLVEQPVSRPARRAARALPAPAQTIAPQPLLGTDSAEVSPEVDANQPADDFIGRFVTAPSGADRMGLSGQQRRAGQTVAGPIFAAETAAADMGFAAEEAAQAKSDAVAGFDAEASVAAPPARVVTLPLAAMAPIPAMPSGDQAEAALDSLRQDFAAALVGPATEEEPPSVAEIISRWQEAQPASDQLFRLYYGWQATGQQQRQLFQQTLGLLAD